MFMKCPICNSVLDADNKFCVKCGAFIKGKRSKTENPDGVVDVNRDSIGVLSNVPGISREDAIFIVRERDKRGGFMNIIEVANYLRKTYEETIELEKLIVCEPLTREEKSKPPEKDVPEKLPGEWNGYAGKIESKKTMAEKAKKEYCPPVPNLVDINHDSEEQIAALPGIGVILAKRTVGERAARHGFSNLAELAGFLKLKQYVVDRIGPLVIFKPIESPRREEKHHARIVDY